MKICNSCNMPCSEGATFCMYCGSNNIIDFVQDNGVQQAQGNFFAQEPQPYMHGQSQFDQQSMANTANEHVMQKAKNNAGGFAIGIGILTAIVAFILPLIMGQSLSDTDVLVTAIIQVLFGAIFILFGALFLKKANSILAIILIVLFILYSIERIIIIIFSIANDDFFNFGAIIWLVFAISAIGSLFKYLKAKRNLDMFNGGNNNLSI